MATKVSIQHYNMWVVDGIPMAYGPVIHDPQNPSSSPNAVMVTVDDITTNNAEEGYLFVVGLGFYRWIGIKYMNRCIEIFRVMPHKGRLNSRVTYWVKSDKSDPGIKWAIEQIKEQSIFAALVEDSEDGD